MSRRAFDNVFVLCTGRCGSTTFVMAASEARNYTASHESRSHALGAARMDYPAGHIEADNRLSWFLGRLDATFGERPLYVHLTRDPEATAQSFLIRADRGILLAYRNEVLMRSAWRNKSATALDYCRDYVATVNANIAQFLSGKPHVERMALESMDVDFPRFWDRIKADGDLASAMRHWQVPYNSSEEVEARRAEAAGPGLDAPES